jgi:hypothetical protein
MSVSVGRTASYVSPRLGVMLLRGELHAVEIPGGRALYDLTVELVTRTMAGAIPGFLAIVPLNAAPHVLTARGQTVGVTCGIYVHRKFLTLHIHDSPAIRPQIRDRSLRRLGYKEVLPSAVSKLGGD